jgi:hypothetical protein
MEYGKLIAVTGMPGLFELVSSKSDGAIVRSLDDNSTKFASTRQHQFSHLESIEVYTVRDNVNLTDIFKAMESAGGKLPDEKDAKAIKSYFEKVYPDLDFERVYTSDMKKMVKWYSIISGKGIEIKLTEVAEEEAPAEEAVVEEEVKPAKKAAKKKAEPKAEEAPAEEAPKKKAAKKKKED